MRHQSSICSILQPMCSLVAPVRSSQQGVMYARYKQEADSCSDDQLERKGCSGALLDMLAEVASQTLHSDPSVKLSPIKRQAKRAADLSCHLSNKKKRMACRSRSGEGNTMDLEHLRSLTANHLLKLFSEFDGDEIRRIFTFTCFMEPEQCRQQFSSFGSEGKARQQMKSHLLEHVHQLELKAERGFQFTVESVRVRQRRLAEKFNGSNRRHNVSSRIKVEPTMKSEPLDENDSSLHNKENNNCSLSENCVLVKPNLKAEKLPNHDVVGNLNENSNNKSEMEAESSEDNNGLGYDNVVEKIYATEEKSGNSERCYGIYEEHNYIILEAENNNTDVPAVDHRKCTWSETKISQNGCGLQYQEKQEKMKEVSVPCHKTPAADLGKFMMAETLCDMVMVCVLEDDQLQLKQLPCVGQEIDVNTYQSFSYKMIRSDDLPVVQDNRKAEPQAYNDEVMREMNCEKRIERDEYIQKKKPKGKAKFIGQSKAEKEMAVHLIEMMKRKGNTESLECYICNPPRSFTAPTTLISHYRSHAGIKPYECRICRSVFTRQHSLNYHMLIHSNQTRFTCTDCGRKFRHPSHFKEHRRRHTGESPYECSDCMLR
ncbi:hypothetical protein B7P43_G01412 [Cryptotermes secundus]|nr:hypothetical protein B7P43_G01412 [Cryptotermes secundus]